jgi:hypothetical protein
MLFLKNSPVFKIIKEDIESLNGKIVFLKGRYCGGSSKCSGLFYLDSKDNPILKIATGATSKEEIFGILIHEYCHFLQWRDDSDLWNKFGDHDTSYSEIILHPEKNKKQLISLMMLEIDCEKCSFNIIKNNNLFDHKDYAQGANAILYKYAFLYNYNRWPENNKKYEKVKEFCPKTILKSYKDYLNIPKGIVDYYK